MIRIPHAAELAFAATALVTMALPLRPNPECRRTIPTAGRSRAPPRSSARRCSSPGASSAEAGRTLSDYFLREKLDSISDVHVDRQRKLVRLTVAGRITREAKLYGDQGCVIHQPGLDSVFFTPVRVTIASARCCQARHGRWATCSEHAARRRDRHRQAAAGIDTAFANPAGLTAALRRGATRGGSSPSATRTAPTRTCSSRAGRWARASPAR